MDLLFVESVLDVFFTMSDAAFEGLKRGSVAALSSAAIEKLQGVKEIVDACAREEISAAQSGGPLPSLTTVK
jgi:hypothetical protein